MRAARSVPVVLERLKFQILASVADAPGGNLGILHQPRGPDTADTRPIANRRAGVFHESANLNILPVSPEGKLSQTGQHHDGVDN